MALSLCVLIASLTVAMLLLTTQRLDERSDLQAYAADTDRWISGRIGSLEPRAYLFLDYLSVDRAGKPVLEFQSASLQSACVNALSWMPGAIERIEIVLQDRHYRCNADREQGIATQAASDEDARVLDRARHLPIRAGFRVGPGSSLSPLAQAIILELISPVSIDEKIVGFIRTRIDLSALFRHPGMPVERGRFVGLALEKQSAVLEKDWLWRNAPVAYALDDPDVGTSKSQLQYYDLEGKPFYLTFHFARPLSTNLDRAGWSVCGGFAVAGAVIVLLTWRLMLARQRLAEVLRLRTARLKRSQASLAVQREEARLLATALVDAGESERQKLGSELHDNTGQLLVAARLLADHIGQSVDAETQPYCRDLSEVLGEAVDSVRLSARSLSAHGVAEQGVKAALERLARRSSHPGCHIRVEGGEPDALDAESRLHLFRIAQEAVSNAMRHGAASEVEIRLVPDKQRLLLVKDNGAGFSPERSAQGMGLQSLRQRAALLGGQLELRSQPGATEVAIAWLA